MLFGGTSMIGEKMTKSWMGSIESIELDWHEGVFVETEASPPAVRQTVHGAMVDNSVPVGVYFKAKCCLCEWAYGESGPLTGKVSNVAYGYDTPDIEDVMRWARQHRNQTFSHGKALDAFWNERSRSRAKSATRSDK